MTALSLALLDPDILSSVMRKNPLATERARFYLEVHRRLTFSVITRYEVLRGLLAKGAAKQLAAFDRLCARSQVLPLTDSTVMHAATIYADLHRRGELIGDADILVRQVCCLRKSRKGKDRCLRSAAFTALSYS